MYDDMRARVVLEMVYHLTELVHCRRRALTDFDGDAVVGALGKAGGQLLTFVNAIIISKRGFSRVVTLFSRVYKEEER